MRVCIIFGMCGPAFGLDLREVALGIRLSVI
jgi:hypothetical protein